LSFSFQERKRERERDRYGEREREEAIEAGFPPHVCHTIFLHFH